MKRILYEAKSQKMISNELISESKENKSYSFKMNLKRRKRPYFKIIKDEDDLESENDNSESEEFDPKTFRNAKKVKTKKISKKKVLKHFPQMENLRKCTSKTGLKKFLRLLTPKWKKIFQFYMTDCFIFDLYIRRLKSKMFLLSKRQFLFSLIENPDLLTADCHFDNNLLKNYCTGLANFIYQHYDEIKKQMLRKKKYKKKLN
jgi:hypothetical protein